MDPQSGPTSLHPKYQEVCPEVVPPNFVYQLHMGAAFATANDQQKEKTISDLVLSLVQESPENFDTVQVGGAIMIR